MTISPLFVLEYACSLSHIISHRHCQWGMVTVLSACLKDFFDTGNWKESEGVVVGEHGCYGGEIGTVGVGGKG